MGLQTVIQAPAVAIYNSVKDALAVLDDAAWDRARGSLVTTLWPDSFEKPSFVITLNEVPISTLMYFPHDKRIEIYSRPFTFENLRVGFETWRAKAEFAL